MSVPRPLSSNLGRGLRNGFRSLVSQAGRRCSWPCSFCLVWVLLVGAAAQAQAPAWQNIHPLEVPGNVFATVAANGSVYTAGSITHYEESAGDPESGPVSTGSNAFVAKWNPTAHRLVWLVQMGAQFRDKDYATALVVRDSSVYVLGQFERTSQGFGHPVRATGYGDIFVTRLTDHGTRATADWTQPLGHPNNATLARHLVCDGATIYVAGTIEGVGSRVDPATGQWRPPVSRAFVAKFTDAGTHGLPGWQRTWEVRPGYHEVVALAAQRGRVYLASNTWQPTPSPSEPQGWLGEGMLPAHADYRVHLTQLRDQGAGYRVGWAHTEAGQGAGLALAGKALYVTGRADADRAFGHPHGQHARRPRRPVRGQTGRDRHHRANRVGAAPARYRPRRIRPDALRRRARPARVPGGHLCSIPPGVGQRGAAQLQPQPRQPQPIRGAIDRRRGGRAL
jgi:hypothetical protein